MAERLTRKEFIGRFGVDIQRKKVRVGVLVHEIKNIQNKFLERPVFLGRWLRAITSESRADRVAVLEGGLTEAIGTLSRAEAHRELLLESQYLELRRYKDGMSNSWLNVIEGWLGGSRIRLAGYRVSGNPDSGVPTSVQYSGAREEQVLPTEEVAWLVSRYLPVLVSRNTFEGIGVSLRPVDRIRSLFFEVVPQTEQAPVLIN